MKELNKMKKKLIIFDMDGTIYLGKNLIDGALETFDYLNKNHIDYVFFTNNSSHDLDFYYKKIKDFGIKCDLKKNFYSSVEVTIGHLKDRNIKDIFVIGNKSFKDKLEKHFNLVKEYSSSNKVDAVVCGFSTELVYQELKDASLYLQTRDIPFIATNGDYRCPIEDGLYIPDCGGMIEWLRLVTNKKAEVMGKPNPEIVSYLAKEFHVNKDEVLVVGDRLYTDILVGINAKVDTLCVLSGECTIDDVHKYEHKPTYILDSIKSLPDLLK